MKIGDRVSVIDEAVSGVITGIHGDIVHLESEDGFALQYSKNQLVVEGRRLTGSEIIPDNFNKIVTEKEEKTKKKPSKREKKTGNPPPMLVDLHIDKLVNSTKGMTNYDILTYQLETAKRQLEFAIRKRIQRIVFIHGIGEGVLKLELEYLLGRYPSVRYYDADYGKFGQGATEVYISQNIRN